MKKNLFILVLILLVTLIMHPVLNAQDQYKARLSVEYHKIMGDKSFISIAAKFKGDDGYEPATMLSLNLYREVSDDSLVLAGNATTDMKGDAQFMIDLNKIAVADSVVKHKFIVKVEDNEKFKDAKKSVSFMDVVLTANVVEKDSINHISAMLLDAVGAPLEGVKLQIMVHRLFAPLSIGESSYKTEKDGTVLVPIEEPLPGIDGKLKFEVMLESKKYGIVSQLFEAKIGTPIVDKSTFDQRTMWSPPNKTPLFLWIFPNLVILGIWIVISILIVNLFRIYKS